MDPGTALGVVSLALDVVKDVYKYYKTWTGRDEDIEEIKRSSLSLKNLFETMETTLDNDDFDQDKVQMIRDSVLSCQPSIDKLADKLKDVKREKKPKTVMQKLDDQRRRALYPFKKETIEEFLKNITAIKRNIDGLMVLLNLDTTVNALMVGKQAVRLLERRAKDIDRQKLFDWLAPVDQSEIHAAALRRHEPETGKWFLEGKTFSDWRLNHNTSMLICDNAGMGKTVLFSCAVSNIGQNTKSSMLGSSLAYFYCSYRKGAQHGLSPILRTLIAQLCPPDFIPGPLQALYEKHIDKFPPGVPSEAELQTSLLEIIQTLQEVPFVDGKAQERDIFVLLDALDELSDADRGPVLKFLEWLSSHDVQKLHMLVTSRDLSEIRAGLKTWGTPMLMDKKGVAEDIRLFVDGAITKDSELSRQKVTLKDQIKERLVDESNPLFRWTALQLDEIKSLRPMRPRNILATLQSLPKDLDETYTRILKNIPKGNSQVALSALRWISLATRPLFIEEIVDACAISLDADPEFEIDERYNPEEILDTLPGLLIINPPLPTQPQPRTHTISLAHFSVLEYLRSHITLTDASSYHIENVYSNHFIAKACLAYLACCNTFELRKDYYPLRGYAWDYWAWHASDGPGKSKEELATDASLLFDSIIQPDFQVSVEASMRLEEKLSHVGNRATKEGSKRQQYSATLRLPFFYDEFKYNNINSAGRVDHETSILFSYEPLKPNSSDIRLIELFPSANKFTEIRCRIFHVSLEDNPEYDGVSYYWGDILNIGYIRANGLIHAVPINLISDLRNLRANIGDSSKVIFADAISFKSGTPEFIASEESSIKVSRMPQIFKKARQVAIGLGGRAEKDAGSIEFIQAFTSRLVPKYSSLELPQLSYSYDSDKSEAIGQSVFEFFQRGWWLRLWPVQEVVLPSRGTLYYGDTAMTFDTFEIFFQMEKEIGKVIGEQALTRLISGKPWTGAKRISEIRTRYHLQQYPTFPELLWATQYHETKERVVKVYGLLGMLDPEEQESKLLAYDFQISNEENFTRAALHILSKYRNLDILSYTSARPWNENIEKDATTSGKPSWWIVPASKTFVTPTWVPDFGSTEWGLKPLIKGIFGPPNTSDIFNAGKHKEMLMPEYSLDPAYIQMQGIRYDLIVEICNPQDTSQITMHRSVLSQSMKLDEEHYHGRQTFLSSKGDVGLGPKDLRLNDIIAVMPGGKVPYVLRKSGDDYKFIGECYVEGIMDGEAITKSSEGTNVYLEPFRLI